VTEGAMPSISNTATSVVRCLAIAERLFRM
jgi:hypothetical protein